MFDRAICDESALYKYKTYKTYQRPAPPVSVRSFTDQTEIC